MNNEDLVKLAQDTANRIDQAIYDAQDSSFRHHLGASVIGRKCAREVFYIFRWCREVKHESRMLRLFSRGHFEEPRFIELLRKAGATVTGENSEGSQDKFAASRGHFGGSRDGHGVDLPGLPKGMQFLTEFKTHNNKSFNLLKQKGVKASKFEHFVQCQVYMKGFNLTITVYLAVNKDNDDLYIEVIPYEAQVAEGFFQRADEIIATDKPPNRITNKIGDYRCMFCDYEDICKGTSVPDINCRTCIYAAPVDNAEWSCRFYDMTIPKDYLRKACPQHNFNPYLLKGVKFLNCDQNLNRIDIINEDGDHLSLGPAHITSQELWNSGTTKKKQ